MTLKILVQGPPEDSSPGDTVLQPPVLAEPAGGLLQTPLGGLCSPWSLEDAVAVKGVEKVEKV